MINFYNRMVSNNGNVMVSMSDLWFWIMYVILVNVIKVRVEEV